MHQETDTRSYSFFKYLLSIYPVPIIVPDIVITAENKINHCLHRAYIVTGKNVHNSIVYSNKNKIIHIQWINNDIVTEGNIIQQ